MKRVFRILMMLMITLSFVVTGACASNTANPTSSTVLVNGETVSFEAYNIKDNNYFKLRDLAKVLSGTEKQFEVSWNEAKNAISLTSGKEYTPVGGELSASENKGKQTARFSTSAVYFDGKKINLTAYNIKDNNYFKLRDVGSTINFGVNWDETTSTISIETSKC